MTKGDNRMRNVRRDQMGEQSRGGNTGRNRTEGLFEEVTWKSTTAGAS